MKLSIIYLFFYMMICGLWTCFSENNLYVSQDSVINLISLILIGTYVNQLYISILTNRVARFSARELWYMVPIFIISISILNVENIWLNLLLASLAALLVLFNVFNKDNHICWLSLGILILSVLLYLHHFKILSAILAFSALLIDTKWKFGYRHFVHLEMIPIPGHTRKVIIPITILFLTTILYYFGLETIQINIIFLLFMMGYSLFLVVNMDIASKTYEDMESFYLLASYVLRERNEFSVTIHDQFIQDVEASKNVLRLKEPDISHAISILTQLEKRTRKIMNYYSTSTFVEYTLRENLEHMMVSVKALYPSQIIHFNMSIDEETLQDLSPEVNHLVIHVIKELVNNIFKHSKASYINLDVISENNGSLLISCESDGANQLDYEQIKKSKRGVLILKALIIKNGGTIQYVFENETLFTKILIIRGGTQ